MSYSNLHDTDYAILIKSGVSANINKTATVNSATAGEPHYTTDLYELYVFNGTINKRVHGLDMMAVYEDQVVCFDGEVVWIGEY